MAILEPEAEVASWYRDPHVGWGCGYACPLIDSGVPLLGMIIRGLS